MFQYPADSKECLKLAVALSRIKATGDFAIFKELLHKELSGLDKKLRSAEGAALLRHQGAAVYIESLIDLFEHSERKSLEARVKTG